MLGRKATAALQVAVFATVMAACSRDTDGAGCHDYRTEAIVGGAALGFLVGALIGRGHTKAEPAAESAPD